jgi:hypothetical protein
MFVEVEFSKWGRRLAWARKAKWGSRAIKADKS